MVAPVQAVVQFENTFANSTPASFGAATTSGNTIFVNPSNDSAVTVTSITDDATPTNTYVQDVADSGASTFGPTNSELWHSTTYRPATTVTVNWSNNVTHGDIMIAEYPGKWNLVSPSGSNHAHNAGANLYGAGPVSGNFSNAAVGDLLIGVTLCNGINTMTPGFNDRFDTTMGSPNYFTWEDFTATGISSTNSIAPSGGFQGWICVGAAYTKVAAGSTIQNALFFNTQ